MDDENDRMIVFGGVANDTWQLPLSGPNANVWTELKAEGQFPPSHRCSGDTPDSAVYDRRGQRLLVFVGAVSFAPAVSPDITGLWQLSLGGPPVWSAVPTTGDGPQSRTKIALDVDGNRLFAVGDGVWSISLDAAREWTHLAELPGKYPYVYDGEAVFVDRARRQLIVTSVSSDGDAAAWALSLDTNAWVRLARNFDSAGTVTVFDEKGDRLITYGANGTSVQTTPPDFDLSKRTYKDVSSSGEPFATGVIDAKRNRVLYFGGRTNAVSSIDLDTFEWAKVVEQTRSNDAGTTSANFIWDPVRSQVVAFGYQRTMLRALGATDDWRLLSVDTFGWESAAPVYDSASKAIVSFGSYNAIGELVAVRLASARSAWEQIDAGAGPTARSEHVGIYDEAHHRMIIHGGLAHDDGGYFELGDVWALTLDGTPTWVPLDPEGPSPLARQRHVGIYEPEGRRMIIYGGSSGYTGSLAFDTDLWSLSLDDAPRWTELTASGRSPGALGTAVYDTEHRRMIVLTFSAVGAARVFALELGDALSWHEFCSPGITPAADINVGSGNAVLAPDGLFFSSGGASFRFNLETPYCDG
jgi:hypothetical protein